MGSRSSRAFSYKRGGRKPAFKPMGFSSDGWGACMACQGCLDDARLKLTRSDGFIAYLCLRCAFPPGTLPASLLPTGAH